MVEAGGQDDGVLKLDTIVARKRHILASRNDVELEGLAGWDIEVGVGEMHPCFGEPAQQGAAAHAVDEKCWFKRRAHCRVDDAVHGGGEWRASRRREIQRDGGTTSVNDS